MIPLVSSYIARLAIAIGLLCLVFVIGIWMLTNPITPPNIPAQYAAANLYTAKKGGE